MTIENPLNIVAFMLESEKDENNNLIEILGNVKPTKSSTSSLSSIVRGLFTKNSRLLALLNAAVPEISGQQSMETLKGFVNDFILWLDNDTMVLFEKYCTELSKLDEHNLDENSAAKHLHADSFSKPITNLSHYVDFIDSVTPLLRNPFILEKLATTKLRLNVIVESFQNSTKVNKLNNISFNNIKPFGAVSPKTARAQGRVSSFFKINQIISRTEDRPLFMIESSLFNEIPTELVLLNLSSEKDSTYNALAILEVNTDRSLVFPPFRVNELSIDFNNSCIILRAINFSSKHHVDSKIVLTSPDQTFLLEWYKKLEVIFPVEANKSPVSGGFLIQSEAGPVAMSGLGINVVSDTDHRRSLEDERDFNTPPPSSKSNKFKELLDTPSLDTSSPLSRLQQQSQQLSRRESPLGAADLANCPQPPFLRNERKLSISSVTSEESRESERSQHDRSVGILNKTLSNTSLRLVGKIVEPRDDYAASVKSSSEDRPRSSQAELDYVLAPTNTASKNERAGLGQPFVPKPSNPYQTQENYKAKSASVPNLSKASKDTGIYQLSSGSALDINNFGKSYNPTFSVKDLNAIVKQQQNTQPNTAKPRRKSFFDIFRKSAKNTPLPSTSPYLPQSPIDESPIDDDESLPFDDIDIPHRVYRGVNGMSVSQPNLIDSETKNKKNLSINVNISASVENIPNMPMSAASEKSVSQSKIPAPFALPSSTSMKFFKQPKEEEADQEKTTGYEEEDLAISDELKSAINDDQSIDFYLSESTPKSMKISKWKEKYGKWEMITVNENLFVKIVVNYELNKSWLLVFKEEYDTRYEEVIDKPILILTLDDLHTSVRQSSAVDLQINAINSVTAEKMLIMIRCSYGSLSTAIRNNVENAVGVLGRNGFKSLTSSKANSSLTIASSMMDKPSASTTYTNLSLEDLRQDSKLKQEMSTNSICSSEMSNAIVLNNPNNRSVVLLPQMTVRLQKQLGSYNQINELSSWKILSMYYLNMAVVADLTMNKNHFKIELHNIEKNGEPDYTWLIADDDKFNRIERIGKAGLLVKVADDDYFMIECKGKREFKQLIEFF